MNATILRRQQYLPQCRKSCSSKCCRNNGNSKCCSYKAVPASVVGTTVIASFVPTRIVGTAVPASVVGIMAIGRIIPIRFVGTRGQTEPDNPAEYGFIRKRIIPLGIKRIAKKIIRFRLLP